MSRNTTGKVRLVRPVLALSFVAAVVAGAAPVSSASGRSAPAPAPASAVTGTRSRPAVSDCGLRKAAVRPASLLVSCGDGNSLGKALHWSVWGSAHAVATGTYTWNPCVPYCAAVPPSKWKATTARFTLSRPVHTSTGWLFERLVVRITGTVPHGMLRTLSLSEAPVRS